MANYDWCRSYIDEACISTIYELGSWHGLDAVTMAKRYPDATVYSFECNPEAIPIVKQNIVGIDNIRVVEKAVADSVGSITFRPFDMEKYPNMGASSLFEIDFVTTRSMSDPDYGRTGVQKTIKVPCTTLDYFIHETCAPEPDMILMDLQGAELLAMKGFVDGLSEGGTKYIVSEASCVSTFKGGCSLRELAQFLGEYGFSLTAHDANYNGPIDGLCDHLQGFGEFNVLFTRIA